MSEIYINCPYCNKEIHTESNVKSLYCSYCETKIDVQKEIEKQGITPNDHVSFYTQLTQLMETGDKALEMEAYIESFACYYKVLEMDKNYIEAARSLLKAANAAIEKHFLTFENMYETQGQNAVNQCDGADLQLFYQAREYALKILDAYGPNYEYRETEIEQRVKEKIKRRRRNFNIGRLITIILTVAIVAAALTLSAIYL